MDKNIFNKISPSIFAADFSNIEKEIRFIEEKGCQYIHLDIMDGNFVPNISYGPKITQDILKITKLKADVHLMVKNPDFFFDKFIFDNVEYITFHYESMGDDQTIYNLIRKINFYGKKAGLSIKPNTDVNLITKFLNKLDLVLVMTVEPGFSGQKIIFSATKKVQLLSDIRMSNNFNYVIEVDGGINFENASKIIAMGADLLVVGSAFFIG